MKKFFILLTAAILSVASLGACTSKNHGDMKCDRCRVDGKKVTVQAMQQAIDRAALTRDDDPIEDLMERMVVKYEANVELCADCADDKYDEPDNVGSKRWEKWSKKMETVLPYAQASTQERYADVMQIYNEYVASLRP